MAPGDTLVLYSDGVTDAQDETGAFFGEERLQSVIRARAGRPAEQFLRALLEAVEKFGGEATQFDDITLTVVVRDI
jgi:sigma-B regulation protein RsbU (phosphoserine phosphatase)